MISNKIPQFFGMNNLSPLPGKVLNDTLFKLQRQQDETFSGAFMAQRSQRSQRSLLEDDKTQSIYSEDEDSQRSNRVEATCSDQGKNDDNDDDDDDDDESDDSFIVRDEQSQEREEKRENDITIYSNDDDDDDDDLICQNVTQILNHRTRGKQPHQLHKERRADHQKALLVRLHKTLEKRISSDNRLNFNTSSRDKHGMLTSCYQSDQMVPSVQKFQSLRHVKIQSNQAAKHRNGSLHIFANGVQFQNQQGEKVNLFLANIKQILFDAEDTEETGQVIHFVLYEALCIGKSKIQSIQFSRESLIRMDESTDRCKSQHKYRNYNSKDKNGDGDDDDDDDDEEEEEEESSNTARYSKTKRELITFIDNLRQVCDILRIESFDGKLTFLGAPARQTLTLSSTQSCLACLDRSPFFVVDFTEVEIVSFERVNFNWRTFDIVLIFKDYNQAIVKIGSVPIQSLDEIKDWLDQKDIVFAETSLTYNWTTQIMKIIRTDIKECPERFLEVGWYFLFGDDQCPPSQQSKPKQRDAQTVRKTEEDDCNSDSGDAIDSVEESVFTISNKNMSIEEDDDDDDVDSPRSGHGEYEDSVSRTNTLEEEEIRSQIIDVYEEDSNDEDTCTKFEDRPIKKMKI